MLTDIARAASATFAANRARGAVAFDVHLVDGVTRRGRLHESGSLRVRFPSPEDDGLSAMFVNTAGGVAGGDRFDTEIVVGEDARLTLTTAAAEKIYRAHGEPAQLNIAFERCRDWTALLSRLRGFDKRGFVHIGHAAAYFERARDDFEAGANFVERDGRADVKRLRG